MRSTRSPSGIVQRNPKASSTAARGHKKHPKARASKAAPAATGMLTIKIVCASIFDKKLLSPEPPDAGRVFDVTLRSSSRGHSKAKVFVRQSSTVGPLKLAPGSYRVDVAEHVSKGVFQKYPAAACEAVVHVNKSTTASAVLATDTLRAVADAFGVRVGVLVSDNGDENDPTHMLTVEHEFNLATVCMPPGSLQPSAPNPHAWLSAPLAKVGVEPGLDATLAANGWDTSRFGALFTKLLAAPYRGIELLPSPLVWFTHGQVADWLNSRKADADPPPYKLHEDHVRTAMRWIKKLVAYAEAQPGSNKTPENQMIRQWVAVNELEDTADTHFWGGIPNKGDRRTRLATMAKRYLEIAHEEDPHALLLMNDFDHEFYPPSARGAKGKLARHIRKLSSHYPRAAPFHRTMGIIQKDGSLHGKVGAGYQMHFPYSSDYLGSPSLYRGALKSGISRLRRLGAHRVTITEMALSVRCFFDKKLSESFGKPPKKRDLTPGSPFEKWETKRQGLFSAHGYAATRGTSLWRKQAQVFRDIVKTYLTEPGCDTLTFWGITDVAEDEVEDVYGHLFDSVVAPGAPQGAYADGLGCVRKPAYYGVLNGLIDAGSHKKPTTFHNWMRRWSPTP